MKDKIPSNVKAGQFWHVIYECRPTIVEIAPSGKGFFAFGQDVIWDLSAVADWINQIHLLKSNYEEEYEAYIEWLENIKDEDEDFYDYHCEMNHLETKDE